MDKRYIQHYGVTGMRWGVTRTKKEEDQREKSNAKNKIEISPSTKVSRKPSKKFEGKVTSTSTKVKGKYSKKSSKTKVAEKEIQEEQKIKKEIEDKKVEVETINEKHHFTKHDRTMLSKLKKEIISLQEDLQIATDKKKKAQAAADSALKNIGSKKV